MKKVAIIGLPGSGKTTFAAHLSKTLNIPVHYIDKHTFLPGGKKRDKQEFLSIQKDMVDQPSWIIEGCAISSLEMRFSQADTVIYFHLPRPLCIWRAFKRLFHQPLPDTPDGSSKPFNLELLQYIWSFDKDKGAAIDHLRKKYSHVNFLTFRTSKDAICFLAKDF